VARGGREALPGIRAPLPAGMTLGVPYDSTLYIEDAIDEVVGTLSPSIVEFANHLQEAGPWSKRTRPGTSQVRVRRMLGQWSHVGATPTNSCPASVRFIMEPDTLVGEAPA
jgi:hypothetical protein